ncbi:MAG: dephospho-CoA kinase [Burkholderiales bacterium]
MVFCVGLTGGIGCGKSLAAEMFAELGAAIVDTDAISRELTAPGGEAIPAIEKAFGNAYVQPNGSLDRAAMRKLVFADADAKARLESILHPLIRAKSRALIDTANAPYAMLVVPLLLETGAYRDVVNRVLVVDCDEARQIERVMARGLSENEVRSIIRAQIDRSERLKQADDVITNDGDINELQEQVRTLHPRYLELARA